MIYPEILTALSGQKIAGKEMWEKYRRAEIRTILENFVYGVPPVDRPKDMAFSVRETQREQGVLQKKVEFTFSGYAMGVDLFIPAEHEKPLPAFIHIMHQAEEQACDIDNKLDFPLLPILEIAGRGYGLAVMKTSRLCPDFFSGPRYQEGVFTALDAARRDNSWSIIAAWAWGVSRVMDYLETDGDIDSRRVAVIGHSRGGKAALWAGATDQRLAMVISNESGCTGAAFTRGKTGEHVKDINGATDWFCENYRLYNDDEAMLPIDQHMLLALIAPRPLYVASASEDEWADPDSELLSCRLAGAAYGLYGKTGVLAPETIENDMPYHGGEIAYHRRTGSHALTRFDWRLFLDFADQKLLQ